MNDYGSVCIFVIISASINSAFTYFHWYLKRVDTTFTNINANTETVTYLTYKWDILNKLLQNRTYYFLMRWPILKSLIQTY